MQNIIMLLIPFFKLVSSMMNEDKVLTFADMFVMEKSAYNLLYSYSNINVLINTNLSASNPIAQTGTTIKAINTLTNGTK